MTIDWPKWNTLAFVQAYLLFSALLQITLSACTTYGSFQGHRGTQLVLVANPIQAFTNPGKPGYTGMPAASCFSSKVLVGVNIATCPEAHCVVDRGCTLVQMVLNLKP